MTSMTVRVCVYCLRDKEGEEWVKNEKERNGEGEEVREEHARLYVMKKLGQGKP